MTTRHPPDWHAEALRMRRDGMIPTEIGRALGRSSSTVYWVLDENGEREKSRNGVRRRRGREPRAPDPAPASPHIDYSELAAMVRRGELTLAEFDARIRGAQT